jgi:hypothetical protein
MAVACSLAKSIRPPNIAALTKELEANHTRYSNLSTGINHIAHRSENIGTVTEVNPYQAGLSSYVRGYSTVADGEWTNEVYCVDRVVASVKDSWALIKACFTSSSTSSIDMNS